MTDRIERTIDLNAPIDRVWRAISDHHEFGTSFRVALDQPFAAARLTVTETGFDALAPDVRDSALRSNEGGWTEQMENIRRHVDG